MGMVGASGFEPLRLQLGGIGLDRGRDLRRRRGRSLARRPRMRRPAGALSGGSERLSRRRSRTSLPPRLRPRSGPASRRRRGGLEQRHGDRRTGAAVRRRSRATSGSRRNPRPSSRRARSSPTVATKPSPSAVPGGGSPGAEAGAVGDRGADQVGEPLEDVDAHGPPAADAEAGGAVEPLGDLRIDRDRGAARAGQMRDVVDALLVEPAVLQRPELRREERAAPASAAPAGRDGRRRSGRPGLRSAARPSWSRLRTSLDDLASARERRAPRRSGSRCRGRCPVSSGDSSSCQQRPEQAHDMGLEPGLEARLDLVARRAGELLVGEDAQARLEQLLARLELRDRVAEPANDAVVGEHER